MIPVLFEDNHCLALDKPAGLLSQGDETGERSVVDWAKEYIKTRYEKPGNVYVGLVHRLDQPVSGVILLAKTSKAATRLSEQFREGSVEKVYWAVVEGRMNPETGEWTDVLTKDREINIVAIAGEGEEGKEAGVSYRVMEKLGTKSLVELKPTTGRGHQLRVQLASRGFPIVGDRKYGARSSLRALDGGWRIALHARSLSFKHPTRNEVVLVSSPVPADWPEPGLRG